MLISKCTPVFSGPNEDRDPLHVIRVLTALNQLSLEAKALSSERCSPAPEICLRMLHMMECKGRSHPTIIAHRVFTSPQFKVPSVFTLDSAPFGDFQSDVE
jgi:hypothetical protein